MSLEIMQFKGAYIVLWARHKTRGAEGNISGHLVKCYNYVHRWNAINMLQRNVSHDHITAILVLRMQCYMHGMVSCGTVAELIFWHSLLAKLDLATNVEHG